MARAADSTNPQAFRHRVVPNDNKRANQHLGSRFTEAGRDVVAYAYFDAGSFRISRNRDERVASLWGVGRDGISPWRRAVRVQKRSLHRRLRLSEDRRIEGSRIARAVGFAQIHSTQPKL